MSPPLDEPPPDGLGRLPPRQQAEALAYFKARAVAERLGRSVVVGADTLVVSADGRVLGKPADADDAGRMLRRLCGTRHTVITGVAVLGPGPRRLLASAVTHVTMRKMSRQELRRYVDSGEWRGKAGAYAIQETADRFVRCVEGSFSNVVGLPVELLGRMLQRAAGPQAAKPS